MMRKVLVANRGEIACRVIRSCGKLGLSTVAVYSEADKDALHVQLADEAWLIGPSQARQSYLAGERIIAAAKESGADAIHPGYGFLSENAGFAQAVSEAGIRWIGPSAQTIEDMGDKERARLLAKVTGLPILSGSPRFTPDNLHGLANAAAAVGYPLLVKAAAGGGGIGMRRLDGPGELEKTVTATQKLAEKSFGDPGVYLEQFVDPARHIEIQVFGFGDGRAVHLFERECSIQRRFQKIIEESPAPGLPDSVRNAMGQAAVTLACQQRYVGAGTIEFVVDDDHRFYFLEMNTRIQVEHPVTEMVTGFDLVELQIRLARGDDLSFLTQEAIKTSGHAIECRIYAENPAKNFLPSPGRLIRFQPPPTTDSIRVDTGFREGDNVSFHYDPMITKVIVRGAERDGALSRMTSALDDFRIEGVATNVGFLRNVIAHPAFRMGKTFTRFVDAYMSELLGH
jgi:3-methylcrotonyl-CoA carboxylase alpha subunit